MAEMNDVLRLLPMLKGIPAGCLLALLLLGPLDLGGLTRATGYSRWRVGEALVLLQTLGLVAAVGQAWTASRSLAERLPGADICTPVARVSESQSLESLTTESQSLKTQDSETQDSGDSETPATHVIEKILALTPVLFEEPVLLPAGLALTVDELLAQLGEVYINRSRLRYPARVVAANLKKGRMASRRFLDQPRAYLPAGFLRQVDGILGKNRKEYVAYSHDWEQAEAEDTRPEPASAPEAPEAPEALEASESLRLWGAAREELARSLPKASFESYVRPVAAVDYDPQQGQLFLEAADGQSCAWLDRHLKRILERLMVGITGEAVEVVFLPPEAGTPDASAANASVANAGTASAGAGGAE